MLLSGADRNLGIVLENTKALGAYASAPRSALGRKNLGLGLKSRPELGIREVTNKPVQPKNPLANCKIFNGLDIGVKISESTPKHWDPLP